MSGLCSVLIPAHHGGDQLVATIERVRAQRTRRELEIVVADSASTMAEQRRWRELGVVIEREESGKFDHGETRDRLAGRATGEIFVFLNQDAQPASEVWLEALIAPLLDNAEIAAAQGAISEFPLDRLAVHRRRFYWDSCGPRFYFTRESERWIARHGGIGFSTVNCAIARWAWEQQPFGRAPILEDKLWQRRAVERGWRIVEAPEAVVWHTHDYDLRSLTRRCASEGFGWRLVGERYSLAMALGDARRGDLWRDWWRGLRSGALRRPAELLFPLLRPAMLWWGNRWARKVLH